MRFTLFSLLAVLAFPSFATEAPLEIVSGEIDAVSYMRLEKQVDKWGSDLRVMLRSHGGNVDSALKMGELVQKYNVTVYALDYCESACSIVFGAAHKRIALDDARIGVHNYAWVSSGEPLPLSDSSYQDTLNLWTKSLGDREAKKWMLDAWTTPPTSMFYVSDGYTRVSTQK